MKNIRSEVLAGKTLLGTWLNLGSSITAEICGLAGFDWVCLDLEHGAGDQESLVHQLQALEHTPAAPLVRVAWNDAPRVKRALDLGPTGCIIPYVSSEEEAQAAVQGMRYPPEGVRGVAKMNRAARFGHTFDTYFREANESLLTVVQIEAEAAVNAAEGIAAVEGVDVLFIGPLDLSTNLGVMGEYQHPRFLEALSRVEAAAERTGKAMGILMAEAEALPPFIEKGYQLLALGSDGGMVASGARRIIDTLRQCA